MSLLSVQYHLFMMDVGRVQARILTKLRDVIRSFFSTFLVSLPPTPSNTTLSPAWLSRILATEITSCCIPRALDENRGFVGGMQVVDVTTKAGKKSSLILKTSQSQGSRLAGLGGIREALFYKSKYAQEPSKKGRIPKVFYSHASRWLGEMVVLMQDLTSGASAAVGVNQLLGNQIWGVKEGTPTKGVDRLVLLKAMYYHAADMHANYWNDKSLLRQGWLRNARWFSSKDRHYWELSMGTAQQGWFKARNHPKLNFPPDFVDILDASFRNSSWQKVQEHLQTAPFTLTHGDYHAANMILTSTITTEATADDYLSLLKVFDWSEVGPWEPVTDLAQTVISDLPIELFGGVEHVLKAYHKRLRELGVDDYSWEECRERFALSGMERWIWVFGAMSSMFDITTSSNLGQHFIDKMNAFRCQFCPDAPYFELKTCGYVLPSRDEPFEAIGSTPAN